MAVTKRWIPNILTLVNLFAGVVAIILTYAGHTVVPALLVWGAALFDSLDGRVARRLNLASEFGRELDSLADLVSFGVAPALLAHAAQLHHLGWLGFALAALFAVCGALRLARFNITRVKGYFIGVPITVAGPLLAAAAVWSSHLGAMVLAVLLLILAGLMVSTIRVPKW